MPHDIKKILVNCQFCKDEIYVSIYRNTTYDPSCNCFKNHEIHLCTKCSSKTPINCPKCNKVIHENFKLF
jgi:hypothetical protein